MKRLIPRICPMPTLITFDALGCIIKFRKPIMEIYVDVSEKILNRKDLFAKKEILMNSFKISFKQANLKWPVFGSLNNISSKMWWVNYFYYFLVILFYLGLFFTLFWFDVKQILTKNKKKKKKKNRMKL
jgi:hypothetical protein